MVNHQHFQVHKIHYLQTPPNDKGPKPFGQQFLISPVKNMKKKSHFKIDDF